MYVVVGLGNPGSKYRDTRHNVGFSVIDLLSERTKTKVNKIKFKSLYGEANIGGEKVLLVKPQTYMNNSGESVLEISNFFKVPVENIIVIMDDIDIDFSALKIRRKGSAGSHNGMKSIISLLRDENFPRVKIGVGRPQEGRDLSDFVLGRFSKSEEVEMKDTLDRAADAVECIVREGVSDSMNKYNG